MHLTYTCISIFVFLILCTTTSAQEETNAVYQSGKRYIAFNLKVQDKLNQKVQKQQTKLLKRLSKKEKRYAAKLKRNDSAGYAKYQQQSLSYDSIGKLLKPDSASLVKVGLRKTSSLTDSLKAIQHFVQDKVHLQGNTTSLGGYDNSISKVQSQGNYISYINDLIGQRTNNLKNINSLNKGKVGGFKGIDKNVFYAKQKMKVFKDISNEPSKLEDEALEILQGQDGFEQYLQNADPTSMQAMTNNGMKTSDLEKMGYQTKRQMQEQLQKKFGSNLGGLQQNMGKQITDYQDKIKDLQSATSSAKQTKQSLNQLKQTDKPSFKINPMRGLPFSKRIEKQYNWQTTRATIDGKPAMFQIAAMAGFKHTTTLTYGIGIATSIGLGKSWNDIRFSFEGMGFRTYTEWKFIYGIGAYAGYERMYKQAAFFEDKQQAETQPKTNEHNTKTYNESILAGLTKTYRINDKWNGSLQVLYDLWWKEKGLRTPIQLRIATLKN